MSASDSPPFPAVEIIVGVTVVLIVIALVAVVVHFVLEKRRVDLRTALEKQLLQYSPVLSDARAVIPVGETVDGSGIPKVRSVGNNVYMLAYGYSLCSPGAEEARVSGNPSILSGYAAEILHRPEDEREWYRNVALAVIVEKALCKQEQVVLGLLPDVTREMSGSTGVKDVLGKLLVAENTNDQCQILNESLSSGQLRTRYVIARALGLLFKEPRASKTAAVIKEQSRLIAGLLDLPSLLSCLPVYPTVYEVYERAIQLRAPPETRRPSTCEVVDHLLQSGDENVYLSYMLHVKKLPHSPFVPKELVKSLLLLARQSPFHAPIVDEILATNLKNALEIGVPRLENAALVCVTSDIVKVMRDPSSIVPDTFDICSRLSAAVERHRSLVTDRASLDWIEEQEASFRRSTATR
jgi:hypothetical protein